MSVVIPSWNQGRFIERTLLSILRQDYPGPVQVIVADGGSTDETVAILQKYDDRLIWWSARDAGFVDAVTQALARATGEIIAIQSSDDYYLPGAFRRMAAAFQAHPVAGFISGGEYGIDLRNQVVYANSFAGPITPHSILFRFVPAQHATFVRRAALERVGGLRAPVDMCADIDLWYRVAHFAPGYAIPDRLAVYQLHPAQRTATSPLWYPSLVRMVESCEQDARYGEQFRLSPPERRNLYAYWEINWTGKRSPLEAWPLAVCRLPALLSYSPRTRRMILGAASYPLKKFLASMRSNTRPPSLVKPDVNLDWWRQ